MQREDRMSTQGEGGRPQAQERGLRKTSSADTLILDVQAQEL